MRTIRLYGELGKRFGKVWRMDVATPAEAIRALCRQLDGFRKYLEDNPEAGYKILTDVHPKDDRTITMPTSAETIRIVPVVCGAGKGLGQIFVGIAVLAYGYFSQDWASVGAYFTSGSMYVAAGTAILMGGVSQMMSKTPSMASNSVERPENTPSFVFDGAVNTTSQGNPVPVCYGEMIVGSQVISAGLFTEQT